MKKIAVMVPIGYRGGSLRAAKNLAKAIAMEAQRLNDDIQVIFSYTKEGNYDPHNDFNDLSEYKISIRETVWKVLDRSELMEAYPFVGATTPLDKPSYCLPMDGINDFFDCDLWIIISDRLFAPLFPLKKYICVIYDYLQRYVPQIFGDEDYPWNLQLTSFFPLVRNAQQVLVTTPSTREDMIAYAGVNSSRIKLIEMDFESLQDPPSIPLNFKLPDKYFLWTTNPSAHKNHKKAIIAYEKYAVDMGGKLNMVVTGPNSDYMDFKKQFPQNDPMLSIPSIDFMRKKLAASAYLQRRITILGNISEVMYSYVMEKSQFLWHPNLYDNGTFSVIEAAYFNKPSLSANYPAMKFIDEKFKLNLTFFDPYNIEDMALSLSNFEHDYKNIVLPERDTLLQRTWKTNAPALYQIIQEVL